MEIKNTTKRNIGLMGLHPKNTQGTTGKSPKRLLIPALSTMKFDDDEYRHCSKSVSKLIEAGYLVIVKDVETKLSCDAIAKRIYEKSNVSVDATLSKEKLQKVATKLGVSLD